MLRWELLISLVWRCSGELLTHHCTSSYLVVGSLTVLAIYC